MVLLLTAATGAWAQSTTTTTKTYKVTMKSGTKDAEHWTISDGTTTKTGKDGLDAVAEGKTVTLNYTGRLKVKSVTATHDGTNVIDLSNIPASLIASDGHTVTVPDGATLTGTLDGTTQKFKVSIADGATVTLDGVTINGVNEVGCLWAGLTCAGDATIILKDGTENTVKGFSNDFPGIFVREYKKLTIKGGTTDPGKLTASPFDGGTDDSYGAGIGGGFAKNCGAIEILGGIITATGGKYASGIGSCFEGSWGDIIISGGNVTSKGGDYAAGIGSGHFGGKNGYGNISITGGTVYATGGEGGAGIGSGNGSNNGSQSPKAICGDITISGGTVEATGGEKAAGIGTGSYYSKCGNISITSNVTKLTATKGSGAYCSIGWGSTVNSLQTSCGTVRIGCTLDTDGNPVGGNTGKISTSPFTYQPSNP